MTVEPDNALARLVEIRGIVQRYARPAVAAWLDAAVNNFLASGMDVGQALGLTRRARQAFLLQRRNTLLRDALALCPGATPSKQAARLHVEIEFFRDDIWPRAKFHETPPEATWPADRRALLALLFWIFRTSKKGRRVPGTQRAIEMIFEIKTENHFETKPAITFVDAPSAMCKAKLISKKRGSLREKNRGKCHGPGHGA